MLSFEKDHADSVNRMLSGLPDDIFGRGNPGGELDKCVYDCEHLFFHAMVYISSIHYIQSVP